MLPSEVLTKVGIELISTGQVAKLLGIDQRTLRKHETPDGRFTYVFGHQLRVFHYGGDTKATRRYDKREVLKIVTQMERGE
jgi:hypothetical protein